MRKVANAFEFILKRGLSGFAKESYYRLIDAYYERHFNVETAGEVSKKKLGIDHQESVEYGTISYQHIIRILDGLPVEKGKSALLDYGCGKGRVIICAAAQGYKKVFGVELSNLIDLARSNVKNMQRGKTEDIELLQCDAQEFKVPSDVNVVYFFNPFTGSVLERVANNIRSSFLENPRKIHIVFFNNDHFEKIAGNKAWLVKTSQSDYYPHFSCGIYETK